MANFFDWLNKAFKSEVTERPKTETQSISVQSEQIEVPKPNAFNAMFLAAILSMESVRDGAQSYDIQRRQAYEQLSQMESIGLGNSATADLLKEPARQYEHYLKCCEIISVMQTLWRKLGEQAVILKAKDFISVLRRHNLVCGFMEDYVGVVPADALENYKRAYEIACDDYTSIMFKFNDDIAYNFAPAGLPWIPGRPKYPRSGELDRDNPFCIAAPRDCFTIPQHEVHDPFIFSCSNKHDLIVIHAKWGAEAEDATIRRYEELRDAITGKGGGA